MAKRPRLLKRRALRRIGPIYAPWFGLALNAWSLGIEVSSVVALRMLRIAAGGAAGKVESRRAFSEKILPAVTLSTKLLNVRTPRGAAAKAIQHYRPKVRANLRRLTKKK